MKKCDIIVPIYNAYDCLKPCIDSIIENTDLIENRLILIDDKSPDDRVLPLLKKYEKENEGIILLQNKRNLGFVKTVNKGMKYSDSNDVLLINSDTEVTKNWLKKIKECAYKASNIATVTPLSNNATLASVPNIFEPNNLPNGVSLSEMSDLIEKNAYDELIEIPTGHGFCLYIKREALKRIGFFDQESYGRGYGEENDFCFRCLDAGFVNVICDNTYILHKESQSFQNEKKELIEQGLTVLQRKFPEYKERLDSWCSKKEIKYLGENIKLSLAKGQDKANVLFVIHDWHNAKNNLGGTTLHAWDIIDKLRDKFNFHVLTPEDGGFKLYSYWSKNEMETIIKFPGVQQISVLPFYNFEYGKMVSTIIDKFNINLIHIHHLIGNYFDIFDIAKHKNIYTIMTLHDYYTLCPRINKLYNNETYCEKGNKIKCEKCLLENFRATDRSRNGIEGWRETWYKHLKNADLLLAPSEAAKDEILITYPKLNIKVIEHGIDIQKKESNLTLDNDILNIAFVGAIGIHKGSKILLDLVNSKKNNKIKIHLFGICNYTLKNNKHFINHGKYKREELPKLLKENNIKVICLLSTWPETFSYTMSESIGCGVPVLAFDFGAIAERIKKNNLGWLIPYNSNADDVIKALDLIRNDSDKYDEVINSINKYKYKTTLEMAKEYNKIYEKHITNVGNIDYDGIKHLIKESAKDYNVESYPNYEWVFYTLKWRIISKIKLPKPIKKVIRKLKSGK